MPEVTAPLPSPGGMAPMESGGRRLLLCNVDGTPHAIEDRCPHAFVRLSEGRLNGHVLECPLHGGKLDVRDGQPLAPPIRRPVRTFAARLRCGQLLVEIPDA